MAAVDPTQMVRALELISTGNVVAIPTETVYGLAADATRSDAVRRIYVLKGRPPTNPLIAHVASIEIAERFAQVDDRARKLFERFSPGPISIVLPKKVGANSICAEATAGLSSVAIRIPRHPIALELLQRFGGALAAPSANRSNHVSPTTAAHVREEFGDRVFIVDGGACAVGIESTVIDLTTHRARLLRPGQITCEMIEAVIGPVEMVDQPVHSNQAALSPGMHQRHYAPRTPAFRFERSGWNEIGKNFQNLNLAVITFGETSMGNFHLSDSPPRAAHDFYDLLRKVDSMNFDVILIEMPSENKEWSGLRDRIRRATEPIESFQWPAH